MFSRIGIWVIGTLLFLVVWAGTFAGALIIKEQILKKVPPTPKIEKPFAFAEPTAEELATMLADSAPEGIIAIPMSRPLTVFPAQEEHARF